MICVGHTLWGLTGVYYIFTPRDAISKSRQEDRDLLVTRPDAVRGQGRAREILIAGCGLLGRASATRPLAFTNH